MRDANVKPLWKTTIVIWSAYQGTEVELEDLARDATSGDAYCSTAMSVLVADPTLDPAWDGTEFFDEAETDG